MSARYYELDDRRFAYATRAVYECPNATATVEQRVPMNDDGAGPLLASFRTEVLAAAMALGMRPKTVASLIETLHRRRGVERDRVDGRLVDRCEACGAKLTTRGYRAYIDEPIPEAELDGLARTARAINSHLGYNEPPRRVLRTTWHDTKREAQAWALRHYREARDGAKSSA